MPIATRPASGASARKRLWRYARTLAAPLLAAALAVYFLRDPVTMYLNGEKIYDQSILVEWLEESRGFRKTLPEVVADYEDRRKALNDLGPPPAVLHPWDPALAPWTAADNAVLVKAEEIREHLRFLGDPPTKMYNGQLPLFPTIYRIEVLFEDGQPPLVWDSELPYKDSQVQTLVGDSGRPESHPLPGCRAAVQVYFQLHAFNQRERNEQEHKRRLKLLGVLAVVAALLGGVWIVLLQRREAQRLLAQQQVDQAERKLLEEARLREESERRLLEQRLALTAAEQRALELKSQLYAGIGIMAGSYAHNIKNLLVRPNDLLRRCLEADAMSPEQQGMLHEVQQTLGAVTERLQLILRTVRRDPNRSEQTVLDLNAVVRDLGRTWRDLARDRYKLDLVLELDDDGGPLHISGDYSHLQQAVENLLFNARDATFEMRNHLREAARRDAKLDPAARKQALITAASWKGRVALRTRREGEWAVLEVRDNGAGMTEEVRRRCVETHFTTKRDNALYEGHNTGMGLGLSFVVAVLEHHHARLEVESEPLNGATIRARFPTLKVKGQEDMGTKGQEE